MTRTLTRPAAPTTSYTATVKPTAPRVDLYAPIHKALRNLMTDTLGCVGRMDVDDAGETQHTLAQVDMLLSLCEGHIRHENDFIHPAIDARQPLGSKRIAGEHVEHLESISELRAEAQALHQADTEQRPALALRLYRHLALFVAENFRHMHIEETAHNAALWAHYSDLELLQLHQRLTASIDPREMLEVGRWMVPALTPSERAMVVNGMKSEAPPEAFLAMLAHIRPHLDDNAWGKLARAVGVAQQPGLVHHA